MASDRGKKIDVWEFVINHVRVSVPVKLRSSSNESAEFFVSDSSLDLTDADSDINALRKRVKAHLQEHLQVTWERYLYIEFRGKVPSAGRDDDDDDDEDEEGLSVHLDQEFEVSEIEIGTKPDGTKCWRNWGKYGGHRSENGPPETGTVDDGWRARPVVRSYVPATKENREAVERLRDAFLKLNGQLMEFLSPDRVVASLDKTAKVLRLAGTK